jgi:hypothetical protein
MFGVGILTSVEEVFYSPKQDSCIAVVRSAWANSPESHALYDILSTKMLDKVTQEPEDTLPISVKAYEMIQKYKCVEFTLKIMDTSVFQFLVVSAKKLEETKKPKQRA